MESTWGPGKIIAGRYRLTDPLGQGGMGAVYRAEHLTLRSTIAVKLIDPEIAGKAEMLDRFQREAQAAASLRSPHVVQILDYGVDEGVPYIAMELLDGESLADRLTRVGRLSWVETTRFVTHVARALARAHEAGIVHRDLKPDNVFLVRNDDQEVAKVLDFGIAKQGVALGSGKGPTRTGNILGTPAYMSPEQAQGTKAVDGRSDLWALGVIGYECVVGHVPFESQALGDLLLKICVHPMPVPSEHAAVPPGFDAWFARACNRDVDQRFQSSKELAEALRSVLAPDAVSSGSISGPGVLASGALAVHTAPTVVAAGSGPVPGSTPRLAPGAPTERSPGVTVPGMAMALPDAPRRSLLPRALAIAAVALGAGIAIAWLIAGRRDDPLPVPTSAVSPPTDTPKAAEPPSSAPTVAPAGSAPPPSVEPAGSVDAPPEAPTGKKTSRGHAPVAHPPPAAPPGPPARLPPAEVQPGSDKRLGF